MMLSQQGLADPCFLCTELRKPVRLCTEDRDLSKISAELFVFRGKD